MVAQTAARLHGEITEKNNIFLFIFGSLERLFRLEFLNILEVFFYRKGKDWYHEIC